MLDQSEMAKRLGVSIATIKAWRLAGLLKVRAYNDKHQFLYEAPGVDAPVRYAHKGISEQKRRRRKLAANPTKEAQCEA
jgi:predicted site-specific integrase-resolvase